MIDDPTLDLIEEVNGTLVAEFRGRSSVLNTKAYYENVIEKVSEKNDLKRLVFDLSRIHPVNNNAGRVLDLARKCHYDFSVATEYRIPKNIYTGLRTSKKPHLPEKPNPRKAVEGVHLVLTSSVAEKTPDRPLEREAQPASPPSKIFFECLGEVRHVIDDNVTVSLYPPSGEIVAVIGKTQFPSTIKPSKGIVFNYRAAVVEDGVTNVSITAAPARAVTSDDIVKIWEDTGRNLPADEF